MGVTAWEDKLEMKTYVLGPDDPNPPLQKTGTRRVYPYPMKDNLTRLSRTMAYRALHLENEYLHLIVLPELGGHLYSLYDKVGEREVFYRNNVVKYGLVANRAAWISGGIEFNFPQPGHSCVTVAPVMSRILQGPEEDGASIVVGCTERITRMRWSVELSLQPHEARLLQRVVLHNPTPLRQRSYYWANSAMPATDDLRLVFPATQVRTSHGTHEYPFHDGKDLSWYRNHERPNDIFCQDVAEDFFGCYYEQQNCGMVHWSDHRMQFGKKFFTWGTADEGMIWVDLLTDDDGQYVELQAGRFVDQSVVEFMGPYQDITWTEMWYPVSGTGGFQFANDLAAANFEMKGCEASIACHVNSDMGPGQLIVEDRGEQLFTRQVTLGPNQSVTATVPLPRQVATGDLTVVLTCDDDEILRFRPGVTTNLRRPVDITHQPPTAGAETTAEELATKGLRNELYEDFERAAELYEKALELDSGLSSAHLGLGLIALRRALSEAAAKHLEQAVARDRQNDEAWYYLALAKLACDETDEAESTLWWLAGRSKCRTEAGIALAKLALRRGLPQEALEIASGALQGQDAAFIMAVSCRLMAIGSELVLGMGAASNPLAAEFVAEAVLEALEEDEEDDETTLDASLSELLHTLGGDPEEWLELALKYARCGLTGDAAVLLRIGCEAFEAVSAAPMVHYHLAHWTHDAEADRELQLAGEADPEYCFPSRTEDLAVLNEAIARDPADWKARMYLGDLLGALARRDEALAAWHAAADIDDGNPVLCRNLALAYGLWRNEPGQALQWYDKAIARRPADHHLHVERYNALGAAGADAHARLAALESAPQEVGGRWDIASLMVACLLDLQRWDDALELLQAHSFLPWEGARGMHAQWTRALVGRAGEHCNAGRLVEAIADYELALTYPRNLGVGRATYPEEARVHWLLAEIAAQLGDEEKRGLHLEAAADERHRDTCEADIFKARALRAIGRDAEADELNAQVRDWAEGLLREAPEDVQAIRVMELLQEAPSA